MDILKMHLKGSTLTMLIMHFCCEHSSQSTFGTVKEVLKIKYFTSEIHVQGKAQNSMCRKKSLPMSV